MKEKDQKVMPVLAGSAFGLVMAILLLALIRAGSYILFDWSFFMTAIVAAALPLCIGFMERFDLEPANLSLIMVIVSFVICVIYALVIGGSSNSMVILCVYMTLVHLPSFIISLIRKKKLEDSKIHR